MHFQFIAPKEIPVWKVQLRVSPQMNAKEVKFTALMDRAASVSFPPFHFLYIFSFFIILLSFCFLLIHIKKLFDKYRFHVC